MNRLLFFTILLFGIQVQAQNATLSGKVTCKNEPAVSTIILKNTSYATSTDFEGNYSLTIPQGTYTIVVKSIGHKTLEKEISITKNTELNLQVKEDLLGLDRVVVTATRGYLNRKKAPVIVTVTDAKVLEATQAVSLSEGLNFQPGLRMENNCQNCGTSEIKMNGLSGSYSQILIDSRPIFSALNSVYGLDQIPANIIKQIEVVRGGGSALYGSNAIAGTINIITKDPSENSFKIGSNLGLINGESLDKTLTFNGTVVNEDLDTGIALFGMKRDREAYDHQNDGFSEITEMENVSFGLKAFTRPNIRKKITAEFNTNHEYRRGGNQFDLLPNLSDVTEEITSDVVSGGLTYEYLSPDKINTISTYASGAFSKNTNYYGGGGLTDLNEDNSIDAMDIEESLLGFGTSEDNTVVTGVQLGHKFDNFLNGKGTFTGGVEFRYNDIDDRKRNPFFTPIRQTTRIWGVYTQQEWQINKKLKVLAGIRADKHNLVSSEIILNPRGNIFYAINDQLRWRASYAKGFRAPQIYGEDVHSGLAGGEILRILNADDLKSETSHSFLTSFDWSKELTEGEINIVFEGFYTRLVDAFALAEGEESQAGSGIFEWVRENTSGAKVFGVNIEAKYAPNEKWLFQAGATAQRTRFDDLVAWSADEPDQATREFNKAPNYYANFVASYAPFKEFQNNLSGVYTGSMKVQHLAGFVPKDVLETTSDFFELNWKSSYQLFTDSHKHNYIEFAIGIQNIFNAYQNDFDLGPDRDVTYIYGPQRPRTYFVGLKFGN